MDRLLPHQKNTKSLLATIHLGTQKIICGVPQGSSLSPILFNTYMAPLADIVRSHGLNIISYADDTQFILSLSKDSITTKTNFHKCMTSITNWMRNNCLKLNTDKPR